MKRRKILGAGATALVVAAAFGVPSPAVAQNTSVQFYGHLDLSVDSATKGIKEGGAGQNPVPGGKVGGQADGSSNLSYFGFPGDHDIGGGYKMGVQGGTNRERAPKQGTSPVNKASLGDG